MLTTERPPIQLARNNKVAVLVDWDNVWLCLFNRFQNEMRLEERLEKMIQWVQGEIGELIGGYGFVFAPEHLQFFFQELCVKNNLRLITCPKTKGESGLELDTVDDTLIWFAENVIMPNPEIGFICLVSGDDDYVPLMEEAERQHIKRVLIPPTLDSLSRTGNLLSLADRHPKTNKTMLFRLDTALEDMQS